MADKVLNSLNFGGDDTYYPSPSILQAITASSTDGVAYTATVPGVTALGAGLSILVTPGITSTSKTPTLNVNGLGDIAIRRRLSSGMASVKEGSMTTMFYANRAIKLTYSVVGSTGYWLADDYTKPDAYDLDGAVQIANGGTGATTAAQARTNLGIQTADGTTISQNADYAEVGEWADGNTSDEDRVGYFVAIDEDSSGTTMVKATSTDDIRGVTVEAPAFSGNCSSDKFGEDGNLLKQYDYVAVMGLVSVIDNGTCTVNEKCMPTDDGTAVPSSNNMGYHVVERIDDTHILIALEPGADMLNRIKTSITNLESELDGKAAVSHTHSTSEVTGLDEALSGKADAYSYGTDDLTAGTSELATGKLYFVYEA